MFWRKANKYSLAHDRGLWVGRYYNYSFGEGAALLRGRWLSKGGYASQIREFREGSPDDCILAQISLRFYSGAARPQTAAASRMMAARRRVPGPAPSGSEWTRYMAPLRSAPSARGNGLSCPVRSSSRIQSSAYHAKPAPRHAARIDVVLRSGTKGAEVPVESGHGRFANCAIME